MQLTDSGRAWLNRMPPRRMRASEALDHHLARIGVLANLPQDATVQLQVSLLRATIDLLEAALEDEHVPHPVAIRVIERVIYGGSPNPAEAEERIRMHSAMTKMVSEQSPVISSDWPQP